ncbi:1,2-phenylacetyl-CoA epoxidase subunit PaaD [Jeotgalibacillus proteolyticus]|uniref:Phenylacetate-CoA oxygenase subunit PaaJ n=1 Tax=Jeotgalibacillus proteolyticus TaxID=2082395 RepID=A0A2S5GHF1_9BACL|nr:1,2-phenylacetyl-CoA epoxidase subunit PaaD [Jeotgalibacillus proteolyticus]PPA72283.1 phenylacetate-CoA oxygenase subunit PaaJ [Jeotgalibacillus proteolyticus]
MNWGNGFTKGEQNQLLDVLHKVKDPEIDSVSIIELGMVEKIDGDKQVIHIYLLPTFMGCPALDIIKSTVLKALASIEWIQHANVYYLNDPPWTSDRVTPEGRERLKEFGIAPPPKIDVMKGGWEVSCPYCDSLYTTMENLFGPTACRSILYCKSCKNPFEAMKPLSTLM